ncbi:methyl-accepting chemotaxis protein [Chroococcidiopsis sp. CCNUC1]|uniref:methyl-accepting chemotaxis protein n=1 Tax=Chroococcidiopsis sp. CCNUC1 TaxID=2653189 RepID=UPI0020205124|nr:methyl-accepting chemotaxis protein [Chroococcidiopsis sp. CCNUC1]URD52939.1 methyl-accepting chemotaxis protein [Chroococcidiopsis sp. CCNUC1]
MTTNQPTVSSSAPQNSPGRKIRFNSIGTVLFISVMGGALVSLGGISFFFYQSLKQQILAQIGDNLNTEITSIEGKLEPVKQSMRDLTGASELLSSKKAVNADLLDALLLRSFLHRPTLAMGMALEQTAYAILPDRQWHGTYFYIDQKDPKQPGKRLTAPYDQLFQMDLFKEDNYPTQSYFKDPIAQGSESWTEPYSWYNIPMTSFSKVIRDRNNKILGITAIDVNLGALSDQISKSVIRNQGYFVLASEQGKLMSYPPAPDRAKNQSGYETVPELKAIWSKISSPDKKERSGLLWTGGKFWAYQRVPSTNWLMMAAVPEGVVLGPVLTITIAGALGAGLLLAAVVLLFVRSLNRRLRPILDECNKLAQADAQTEMQMQQQDEIGRLSTSFFNLLKQVAANEDRIRDEVSRSVSTQEQLKQAELNQQEGEALSMEVIHILDVVSAVEEGDLTVQADVSDRATGLVADTLNRLLEKLGQVLAQVYAAAEQVSVGSSALGQLAETVANNAATQAQEVEQVLQLTQQVGESAQDSAGTVDRSNQSLTEVQSAVEQGQVALEAMTKGIDVLSQGTDRIIQKMKTLGEFVGLADQFVQDQSQIASLTQVLALNATLVAARASEQRDPRQFLVVAREFEAIAAQVSTLAQQTNEGLFTLQQRTDQIHSVVSAIDGEVQSLGGLVSDFTTGVEQSNQVFSNVRSSTVEVVQAGLGVSRSSDEILHATQSTAQAMNDIADLAKRTALLTQSTRLQSEQMQQLSRKLLSSIQFFRLPETALKQNTVLSDLDLLSEAEDTVAIELTTT